MTERDEDRRKAAHPDASIVRSAAGRFVETGGRSSQIVRRGKATRTRAAEVAEDMASSSREAAPDAGRGSIRGIGAAVGEDVAWPSGEGREIGTWPGTIDDLLDVLGQRLAEGSVGGNVSYGEDGAERAIVLGPPARTLACLLSDETQAPGTVAVVADVAADPAAAIEAVEAALGPGYEVRPTAA